MTTLDAGETDQAIIRAILSGDRERYGTLIDRYQTRIQNMLRWMCGNSYDAEELCQDVFVRAYFALHTHDPERSFSTWLFQIAHNLALTFIKRRDRDVRLDETGDDSRTLPVHELVDPGALPADVAERDEAQCRLWAAVADLPEDFRAIVLMRHVGELSYIEICEATGLPMGTVKSRLARARERLAGAMSVERTG